MPDSIAVLARMFEIDFAVISSPDPEAVVENVALQNVAHDILQSVFDIALDRPFKRLIISGV